MGGEIASPDLAPTYRASENSRQLGERVMTNLAHISAITLDALLELVGGQVIQELGEDGLSSIHPVWSKKSNGLER